LRQTGGSKRRHAMGVARSSDEDGTGLAEELIAEMENRLRSQSAGFDHL